MNRSYLAGRTPPCAAHRQKGVTLIEVLIALLVLGIGLLGVAAIQGFSLQANQISYVRTQATNLAYELADHARAHRSMIAASGNVPNAGYWSTRAAQLLPQGEIDTAVTNAATDGIVEITVTWLDDREENSTAEFTFQTRI
ncbi:type IV pilus modification protein PilV [Halomonas denitrificans]|nr:type IV pilus modification protein PilV [Halomonas denitrificans]